MKLTLFNTGKTDVEYIRRGIEIYGPRINHFINFSIVDLPAVKHTRNTNPADLVIREGKSVIQAVSQSNFVVLLDEKGREYSSEGLAEWLSKLLDQGTRNIAFVTGGAYGFSKEVYDISQHSISLSKMTFTHQMVRLIFVEQLYRALTIIRGLPYHNN